MSLPPLSLLMMKHTLPVVETLGQLIHMWIARLNNLVLVGLILT